MKINLTYTVNKKSIPDYYHEVLNCYGLSAKNIKNSTLFIIKNIFTSYTYDKDLKTYTLKNNLHQNQLDIISTVNQTISTLNAKLKAKYEQKLNIYNKDKEKYEEDNKNKEQKEEFKLKEPKLIQFNEYSQTIDSKTYYQIINKTLLENVIKTKELNNINYQDYSEVHSHLAQSVVQQVCDEYNYYFKALKEYFLTKDKNINQGEVNGFTGMPKEPQYKAKHSKITFEISKQRFNNDGTVLLIGSKHKLYKDYAKKELINNSIVEKFNSFSLMEIINQDLKTKNIHYLSNVKDYEVVGIRVIPGKYKKKPKVEYIISFNKELKGFYPALINKSINMYDKDFFELKDNLKLNVIKDYFNNDYKDLTNNVNDKNLNNDINIPYFMGLDLGVVNFATVSFYTANRDKNYVISGKTLKSRINNLDIKIDKKKKELCIDVIKTIQSKKDKKEVLTRQELNLLNEYYKSIYENKIISVSQERKSNISSDFIHKLSKCLIEECMSKEIKVIVVGKNKGWKNEINNGAKNNRAMYNFPHAKFIETLKYKALLKDIVVIEVEESYTSKTSFIDNEELRVFNNDEERNLTQGDKSQLSKGKKKLVGKRINQKFISKEKKVIHADVNGSFNIVRKVLLNFSYKEEIINLSYELMEISNYRKRKLFNFYKTKEINKVKNENLTLNEHCG